MSSAHHDLASLVRLQGIYDSISAAIAERNNAPEEIQELQEANRIRQEELEELERQMAGHEEEIKEVRRKEAEWELELEHFQKQKGMVTNEREFTAVISEIDYATTAIKESAARREELEQAIAQIKQEITERRESRPEEETAHREVLDGWETTKTELLERIHVLSAQAKEVEEGIQPKTRARFLRLLESKQGAAVSEVIEGSCSLCHFSLRPHLQQRVRRCEEIIDCEHCQRILYITETINRDQTEAADG